MKRRLRQLPRRDDVPDSRWHGRVAVGSAHRRKCRADAIVHREERDLRPVGAHDPPVRCTRRKVGEVATHHSPPPVVELELDFAAEHQQGGMAAQVDMSRHGCAGQASERHELVDVAGLNRPCDARHHLAADEMMLAPIRREHVHAARAREPADDRHRLLAAHLHGVENLVWKVRRLLRGPRAQ